MKVREIMTTHLSCCTPETSLEDVSKMMLSEDCGAIPVVDNKNGGKPIGIITDRDIVLRSIAKGRDPMQLKAYDCMTKEIFTVEMDEDVEQCYHLMIDNQVRRVVVTENGEAKGIVAQADIATKAPDADTASVVERVSEPKDE